MLQRLRLRNYRKFTDSTSPEFARMNVILGANGAGKSSIKDALALLFSGTSTGREGGRDLAGLRQIGGEPGKKWQINAQLIVKGKLETISRTDAEGPNSDKQKLVEALTGTPGAKARACIAAGELKRLDAKARQRFVLDLIPKGGTAVPSEIRKAVKDLLGEDHAEVDLPTLERLYSTAYEARTEAHRIVKDLGDLTAPEVPEVLGEISEDPSAELADIKVQISELRTQRDQLLQKAAPATINVTPYADTVAATTRELERIRLDIGKLPTKLEIGHQAEALVNKMASAGKENVAIEETRRKLRERQGAAEGAMKQAKTALETIKALKGETGCCPTCESKLTKTTRAKLEHALQNKYDAAGREWAAIKSELDVTPEGLSTVALEKESDALQAKETRLVELLADETRVAARLVAEKTALENAKATPETPGDPEASDEADRLADRIEKGEEIRDALVSYLAALQAFKRSADHKANAMKRHAALDQLVTDLGPGGLRKSVGGDGLLKLHDDLNALLEPRGFAVDLRPALDLSGDPLITIDGTPTPLGEVSDGELIAFDATLACAMATYTGLGIVVVDKFEQLTPAANEAVTEMLEASGHQVFIFIGDREDGTEARAAEMNAADDGWRMFLLRGYQLIAPGLAAEKETAA